MKVLDELLRTLAHVMSSHNSILDLWEEHNSVPFFPLVWGLEIWLALV